MLSMDGWRRCGKFVFKTIPSYPLHPCDILRVNINDDFILSYVSWKSDPPKIRISHADSYNPRG
jgi:hypothetical protein